MYASGFLSGSGPVVKRYMAGTTIARAGIPLLGSIAVATDLASVEPFAATTAVNTGSQVGLALSVSGTIAATGITDSRSLFVEVVVNPDLILGARANAGNTSGTALATTTTTAASTAGTVATGTTTIADGLVYCVSGANAGDFRRAGDTAGAFSINFSHAIASGDVFLALHGFPCVCALTNFISYNITSDLTEVVAQTSVVTMDDFTTLDIIVDPNVPTLKTKYLLIANNHLFGSSNLS